MMAASVTKVAPRFAKDTTPTTTSSAASSPCAMRQPVDEDTVADHDLIDRGDQAVHPEQHGHRRDGGVVEAQDHDGQHDPGGAGDQQQPPEPGLGHGVFEEMTHWPSRCRAA